MAWQFAESSLYDILVDVTALANEDLVALAHSWHVEDIYFLYGKSFDLSTPV